MEMQNQFGKIIEELQKKCPVIHHITNYVTVESCADAAICAGASPVMADDPEEVGNITAGSDALVLNIGTIDYNKTIAMERAAAAAQKKGIPVVLDPVGAMSSAMRLNFALKLLQSGAITIVRGNYDECKALVDEKAAGRGVDGITQADEGEKLQAAKALAAKFNCVVALTGKVDYVSNGKQVLVLNGGNEMLKKITGAGCMTTTLCACCAAVCKDYMTAAALGVVIMGQAAELAAGFMEKKDGPGMFKTRLFDGIYHVTGKWNLINLKPEERMN